MGIIQDTRRNRRAKENKENVEDPAMATRKRGRIGADDSQRKRLRAMAMTGK